MIIEDGCVLQCYQRCCLCSCCICTRHNCQSILKPIACFNEYLQYTWRLSCQHKRKRTFWLSTEVCLLYSLPNSAHIYFNTGKLDVMIQCPHAQCSTLQAWKCPHLSRPLHSCLSFPMVHQSSHCHHHRSNPLDQKPLLMDKYNAFIMGCPEQGPATENEMNTGQDIGYNCVGWWLTRSCSGDNFIGSLSYRESSLSLKRRMKL